MCGRPDFGRHGEWVGPGECAGIHACGDGGGEVGFIERGQGKVVGHTAGSDLRIIDRAGSAAALGVGSDLAPHPAHIAAAGDLDPRRDVSPQLATASSAEVAHMRPLRQLAHSHEGDRRLVRCDLGAEGCPDSCGGCNTS